MLLMGDLLLGASLVGLWEPRLDSDMGFVVELSACDMGDSNRGLVGRLVMGALYCVGD